MEISKPTVIFFLIILMIGILTTFTDLKNKKIYNQHLAIGAVLGLIVTAYAGIFGHEHILFHFVNGLVAFIVGFILHRSAVWRGGDVKLFTLYAFLMPSLGPNHTLLFEPTYLFACSFIVGMIILTPIFIKDIILNYSAIVKDLLLPEKCVGLFTGVGTTILFSWIFLPIYYLAKMTSPVIILIISYLVFSWGYSSKLTINLKKISIESFFGFVFGFLMRLWLSPDSLSYPALKRFIIRTVLASVLAICIHTTFDHFKGYQDRVPFAPLLFTGCVLSYTPFLIWIMDLMHFTH